MSREQGAGGIVLNKQQQARETTRPTITQAEMAWTRTSPDFRLPTPWSGRPWQSHNDRQLQMTLSIHVDFGYTQFSSDVVGRSGGGCDVWVHEVDIVWTKSQWMRHGPSLRNHLQQKVVSKQSRWMVGSIVRA